MARGYVTDNDVPNNEFRNTTLSGIRGIRARARHDAAIRRPRRARRRRHAGTDGIRAARSRRVLQAPRRRRGVTFIATGDRARSTIAQPTVWHRPTRRRPICLDDPPYTPSFERQHRAVRVLRLRLRQPHRAAPPSSRATRRTARSRRAGRAGTHVDTALIDWDGERATLRDALAERDEGQLAQQRRRHAAAPGAVAARVRDRRRPLRSTTPASAMRRCPGSRPRCIARTGPGSVGDTQISSSFGRGIKEPTILQSFSPHSVLPGQSRSRSRRRLATFEAGVEQRFAERSR